MGSIEARGSDTISKALNAMHTQMGDSTTGKTRFNTDTSLDGANPTLEVQISITCVCPNVWDLPLKDGQGNALRPQNIHMYAHTDTKHVHAWTA